MNENKWQKSVFVDLDKAGQPEQEPAPARSPQEFDPRSVKPVAAIEDSGATITDGERSRWGRTLNRLFFVCVAILLGYAVGAELSRLVRWSFAQHEILGWISTGLVGAAAATGLGVLVRVRLSVKQMQRASSLRAEAEQLSDQLPGVDSGAVLIERLEKHCVSAPCGKELTEAIHLLDNQYNGAEMIRYLSLNGLTQSDKAVQQLINESSTKSGLLIAISPLVSLDLLIMAWSNWQLLHKISQQYGIVPSLASQYRLFRMSLMQLGAVGLTELAIDTSNTLVSDALVGKLSLRAGQGVAAAMLSARFGLQAQILCRPLPFIEGHKPTLGNIRSHLLEKLTSKL